MFDSIGWGEIAVLALAALFIFGPDRLPGLAKEAAQGLKRVREAITVGLELFNRQRPAAVHAATDAFQGAMDELDAIIYGLIREHRAGPDRGVHHFRRRGQRDPVDLLLLECAEVGGGFAEGFSRGAAVGDHGAADGVPFHQRHRIAEVPGQFCRRLTGAQDLG